MNCLQSRRLLLASPREQSAEHEKHISACEGCARLDQRLGDLERSIENAALVPVPEALTHRILLRRRNPAVWRYAAAAVVAILSIGIGLVAADVVEAPGFPRTVEVVGPTHPAVIAIAEVVYERDTPDYDARNDVQMDYGLRRLGLSLKPGAAVALHVGACHIEGTNECELIVLRTPEAHANVMLLPDYPLTDRVLVTDRHMVALVSPVARGGYIVVADSAKAARSVDKLFVRGAPLQSAKSPKPANGSQNSRS
jgi:Protein of unknown function (DUF3379)